MGEIRAIIHDATTGRWLRFSGLRLVLEARAVSEVMELFREVERLVEGGLYAVGFVSYEAAPACDAALKVRPGRRNFPLVWFGIYEEAEHCELDEAEGEPGSMDWQADLNDAEYADKIGRVREYIAAGDTYQVNFSYRLHGKDGGNPYAFWRALIERQQCRYGACIETDDWAVCSASPELFFSLDGEHLVSKPMKGTAARGLWPEQDRLRARELAACEKNRAENVMIVDMVRNDMGRIARKGSVRVASLFDTERYPTLWQMVSTVECESGASMGEIMGALFPAASITGAPKVRTMEIIAELESSPRHIYTGSVGFVMPGRRMQFNVAIRTVLEDKARGEMEYGVGGGIVWDSDAALEQAECRTKALVLGGGLPDFSLLETLLWTKEEGYYLLDRHLKRMTDSAEYFGWAMDADAVRAALEKAAQDFCGERYRVRLLVGHHGTIRIEPTELAGAGTKQWTLCLAKEAVDSRDVFLYHKTTHRQTYEAAKAAAPECNDVLLYNERDELTESCIANLVVEKDGQLLTPPVECGLLAGTARQEMLENGKITEAIIQKENLPQCTRLFLLNSVRGLWEVRLS
ncbi:MAG: aminodeoxychorismate synthase component I [Candidatus Sumerlaeia bacterium]